MHSLQTCRVHSPAECTALPRAERQCAQQSPQPLQHQPAECTALPRAERQCAQQMCTIDVGNLCKWPAKSCKETIERWTWEECTALSECTALRRAEGQSAQQSAQQMCTTDMRAAAEPRWDYADCDLRASPRSLHRASG